jgi:hypothetical protein
MTMQNEYKDYKYYGEKREDRLSEEIIYLPIQPAITTRVDIVKTFDIIQSVIRL